MTKNEANIRSIKGVWNNISEYIREKIENACDDGDFEIRVDKCDLSEADVERLETLGYSIIFDNSDIWCPEFIVSWN